MQTHWNPKHNRSGADGDRLDRLLCHPAVSLGNTEGPRSISDVTLGKMGTVRADSWKPLDPTPSRETWPFLFPAALQEVPDLGSDGVRRLSPQFAVSWQEMGMSLLEQHWPMEGQRRL